MIALYNHRLLHSSVHKWRHTFMEASNKIRNPK